MRQILVLGLLAALAWWLYGEYVAKPADAAAPEAGVPGGAAPSLSEVLSGRSVPVPEPASGEVAPPSAPVGAALDTAGQDAFAALVTAVEAGDVAAMGLGWRALADGRLEARLQQRLGEALVAPAGADFGARLMRLGGHNGFLHSERGRAEAEAALDAALLLPAAEAVAAGTRLLDLCLRGPIEKKHQVARAFVDRAFAKYRKKAESWLCNPANVAGARSYTVVSGDSLNRIASRFRKEGLMVEEGTLALLNRIHNKNSIQIGQRIKVPVDPIRVVIEKRSYSLALYVGESLLRLYWVGHGRDDKTPVTTFTVGDKQPKPQWTAPDGNVWPYGHPNNILGEYWIQLRSDYHTGFGIHGTPMPETIGTMSSDGCIRMLAGDITELFDILPRGAPVEVRASEAGA